MKGAIYRRTTLAVLLLSYPGARRNVAAFSALQSTSGRAHFLTRSSSTRRAARTSARLYAQILDKDAFSAAASLAISTSLGMSADKRYLKGAGAGTMLTILIASHLSNLGLSPTSHYFYDMCWNRFLPASLVLLLLSPSVPVSEEQIPDAPDLSTSSKSTRVAAREEIGAVSIPFTIGCIGSIVGSIVSFLVSYLGKDNRIRQHSHILKGRRHFFWLPDHLLLKPTEAACAAGCLCASYIGGPINFFATARIISKSVDISDFDGASGVLKSTFGSSASDLLIMAVYFSTVTASLSSRILQRWFPGRAKAKEPSESAEHVQKPKAMTKSKERSWRQRIIEKILVKRRKWKRQSLAFLILLPACFGIVDMSNQIELATKLPGVGSLSICILATAASRLIRRSIVCFNKRKKRRAYDILCETSHLSSVLSDVCFYLLFAAIGSTASLGDAIREGPWHTSSSFIFAGIALAAHIIIILFGSLAAENLFPSFRLFPLGIEEVMVASNAAIGGPVTAAAVAAGISAEEESSKSKQKGLILAASVWGVVGYAIATTIGVHLSKILLAKVG